MAQPILRGKPCPGSPRGRANSWRRDLEVDIRRLALTWGSSRGNPRTETYAPGGALGISKVGGGTGKEYLLIKDLWLRSTTYLFFGFPCRDLRHLFLPSSRSFFVLLIEHRKKKSSTISRSQQFICSGCRHVWRFQKRRTLQKYDTVYWGTVWHCYVL